MSVVLKNISGSTIYTFPPHDAITGRLECFIDEGLLRLDTSDRAFGHGADIVGDSKLAPKTISFKGYVQASSWDNLRAEIKNMKEELEKCSRAVRRLVLSQYSSTGEYYIVGGLARWKIEYPDSVTALIEVDLLCNDPIRYDASETTSTTSGCAKNTSTNVTVAVSGDIHPTPPKIQVECAAGKISSIAIRNTSELRSDGTAKGALVFNYQLEVGETLEIDQSAGTVLVKNGRFPAAGQDMIRYLVSGEMFNLIAGNNTLRYNFAVPTASVSTTTINLAVVYRRRWL